MQNDKSHALMSALCIQAHITPALILRTEFGTYLRHGAICCYQQVALILLLLLLLANFRCDMDLVGALRLIEVSHSVVELDNALVREAMQQCVMDVAPVCTAGQHHSIQQGEHAAMCDEFRSRVHCMATSVEFNRESMQQCVQGVAPLCTAEQHIQSCQGGHAATCGGRCSSVCCRAQLSSLPGEVYSNVMDVAPMCTAAQLQPIKVID